MKTMASCTLLLGLLAAAQAAETAAPAVAPAAAPAAPAAMVAPGPMPAPADTAKAVQLPNVPPDAPVAASAAPAAPAVAPVAPAPSVAPAAPVAKDTVKAVQMPLVPAKTDSVPAAVVQTTIFKAEKIKPGKLDASAKSDKNRPAKAANRDRWRANRIEKAERGAEISRNDGRRLRIQSQRLNRLEVKKEQGAALSPQATALLDSMLVADLDLAYYAGQDRLWKEVSRELDRLDDGSEKLSEPARKDKYQKADDRVPVLR